MKESSNTLKKRYAMLSPHLNEKQKRLFLGIEAEAIGYGGVSQVSKATGVSRQAIALGMKESKTESGITKTGRIRKEGGGRKRRVETDDTLRGDLEKMIAPSTSGDPESPLRWTSKSVRNLSAALNRSGHKTSHRMVAELLHEMGYSLQANRKAKEGESNQDRDQQFRYINDMVIGYIKDGQPVISVDAKKKELVGDFKNNGKELRPKKDPERVRVHDFEDKALGKVNPYGVYDIGQNVGWVNVGIDSDTAAFAVESIRRWWNIMGKKAYPNAKILFITADGGGSNSSRSRLWKVEIQAFANETGLEIKTCHFPPGTSKWNKIEHRLFSYISQNWRGKPLISHEVIVSLIASTKTKAGLRVECQIDGNLYQKGIKISDEELKKVNLKRDDFHGEWNYSITPMLNT